MLWLIQHNPLYQHVALTEWQPDEVEAADAEARAAEQATGEEQTHIEHAVALPADPALQPGELHLQLGLRQRGGGPVRRRHEEEVLYFQMHRVTGQPVSIHTEKALEALAFPTLYPLGRNHYGFNREILLRPTMYFRSRISNQDPRFQVG